MLKQRPFRRIRSFRFSLSAKECLRTQQMIPWSSRMIISFLPWSRHLRLWIRDDLERSNFETKRYSSRYRTTAYLQRLKGHSLIFVIFVSDFNTTARYPFFNQIWNALEEIVTNLLVFMRTACCIVNRGPHMSGDMAKRSSFCCGSVKGCAATEYWR